MGFLLLGKNMDYNSLLGREPVEINLKKCLHYVRGKRVLITGAGGSIGSEISKQMLFGEASRLFLLGHGENSIFNIERKLRALQHEGIGSKTRAIVPIIGEIQDRDYIFYLFKNLRADVVFHTAAHKHLWMSEINPVEVIKNNVFGTKHLIDASKEYLKEKFIMISSDKSVEPVSIYGASKFLAEELALRERENHKFLVVRFGNVIGSRGSVFEIFEEQILNNKPVTLTSPKMYRFFMTIEEAVSLILKIGSVGEGGNAYILDMGKPIQIKELSERIAKYYSKFINQWVYIKPKRGEKLEEKLWSSNEEVEQTRFPKILKLSKKKIIKDIDDIIISLKPVCFFDNDFPHYYRNKKMLADILNKAIPTLNLKEETKY